MCLNSNSVLSTQHSALLLAHRSAYRMQLLQRPNPDPTVSCARTNRLDYRLSTRHRRDAGNAILQSRTPNCLLVKMRGAAQRRINHQRNLAALDQVNDIGPSLVNLEDALHFQTYFSQTFSRAQRCYNLKTESRQPACQNHG